MGKYLFVRDASRKLDIDRHEFYNKLRNEEIPGEKKVVGGIERWVIDKDELLIYFLDRYMEESESESHESIYEKLLEKGRDWFNKYLYSTN